MTYTTILTETHGRVGLVTLNRPEAMNAFNRTLTRELMDALEAFDNDDAVGAIVVTGNQKAFAAGADIKEMADKTVQEMADGEFIAQFGRIRAIRKPVIAAVSGWALGGGCEVAMSCDMIVASETAKFGQPEITIGVIPGAGGTQRLTRAVGKRTLSAAEALQFGLINRIVPIDAYLEEALKLAEEVASRAPVAIRSAKKMINQAYEQFLGEALSEEQREFYNLFGTEDQKEGMRAFAEKRKPQWKGK
jgi:enoyl-CoA hydratase